MLKNLFESPPRLDRLFSRMRMCKRRSRKERGRRMQSTMSLEPHGSRLLRTDLPPTDSEAKVLAELTSAAAAATWWSSLVPQQSRPARSNLRHVFIETLQGDTVGLGPRLG